MLLLIYRYLQQQKLLELTSLTSIRFGNACIYNSRNYQSLLAFLQSCCPQSLSTIVEIIRAYQPSLHAKDSPSYLQQQKLLELTSLMTVNGAFMAIYNSRNYQSLLAIEPLIHVKLLSTIVEIIRAYQPTNLNQASFYLQQQKLLELTSLYKSKIGFNNLQQQKLLELTSQWNSRNSY